MKTSVTKSCPNASHQMGLSVEHAPGKETGPDPSDGEQLLQHSLGPAALLKLLNVLHEEEFAAL